MCHELLCCFGQSEPDKRSSGREEVVSSPPKPSAAINGGVQAPSSQPNKAPIYQDEIQDQEQIKNENNQEKPMSSSIQGGEKQPKDKQDQQNRQEQDEDKLSKIAKALSFKPKGSKEEKSLTVPPENHKSSEEKQKVLAQDVFPKEKKYSPKEQDLGTKKPATSNQEQQVPSPPKEQIRPQQNRQEQDEDKLSKIAKALSFKPKGSKEEKSPRVPPENHKSSEEKQKVLALDVFPKEKKYSPKEQDLGTKKPATSNQEQQVPSPPKEQIRSPQEKTDQKTKIADAEGNKEFDPSGDDS